MNARSDPTLFLPVTPSLRMRIEATIEQLVALLDEIDGDPDMESANDDEPSLGWPERMAGNGARVGLHRTGEDDREIEDEHDEDGADREPDCDEEEDFRDCDEWLPSA